MSRPVSRNQPPASPPDLYPVVRLTAEFFMRGVDLLTRIQSDRLISGLVFITVWYAYMRDPANPGIPTREISRRLAVPYETVRRHARQLVAAEQCCMTPAGIAIVPAVLRSGNNLETMRKIYFNAERMLAELTRHGLANFQPLAGARRGRLSREQMIVAAAATGRLLDGVRLIGDYWSGDVLRALVYTAIWTANVKHVTNTSPMVPDVLPDDVRQPVSVLAISNSLRLPYETVRRHVLGLQKEGICQRVGAQGLVVPQAVHRRFTSHSVANYELLTGLLSELRSAGIKV